MYIATIDAGTTNTRVCIWLDGRMITQTDESVGVRNTAIDGNNTKLKQGIAVALRRAVNEAGCRNEDIALVLASGMLTSNVGIYEIPHIVTPAGKQSLADAMISCKLPEVWSDDIWFIPGIKNFHNGNLEQEVLALMDIMRGEEVEVYGAVKRKMINSAAIIVLPGSHNKYIALNADGEIAGSITTIAGELLNSLTFDTIIADAVQRRFADVFVEAAFLQGVAYYESFGLGRASFMARILHQFAGYTPKMVRNYLLGLVLADDMSALRGHPLFGGDGGLVFVGGKSVMQEAYSILLRQRGYEVVLITEEEQSGLSGAGAIEIARARGLITA